jgi:DNA-binding LacI/PurR family transcriptional regulator
LRRKVRRRPTVPHNRIDTMGVAQLAVQHLIDRGHRHIGIILGPEERALTRGRLAGYKQALKNKNKNKNKNIEFDKTLAFSGNVALASGSRAVALLQA